MTNPARSVLLVTVTEPGLQEQQDAELAQKLADMKAAMTDEELDALIAGRRISPRGRRRTRTAR